MTGRPGPAGNGGVLAPRRIREGLLYVGFGPACSSLLLSSVESRSPDHVLKTLSASAFCKRGLRAQSWQQAPRGCKYCNIANTLKP